MTGVYNAPITTEDKDNIKTANALMYAALAEAEAIKDESSGLWASLKSKVTGAQLDAMKSEVLTMEKAVNTVHDAGVKILNDPNATHEKAVDWIRSAKNVASISALKESSNLSKLSTLVEDVSRETAKDVSEKARSVTGALWESLPWYGKAALVGVPAAALFWKLSR